MALDERWAENQKLNEGKRENWKWEQAEDEEEKMYINKWWNA